MSVLGCVARSVPGCVIRGMCVGSIPRPSFHINSKRRGRANGRPRRGSIVKHIICSIRARVQRPSPTLRRRRCIRMRRAVQLLSVPFQCTRDSCDINFLSKPGLEPFGQFSVRLARILIRKGHQLGRFFADTFTVFRALFDDHVLEIGRLVGPPTAELNFLMEPRLEPVEIGRFVQTRVLALEAVELLRLGTGGAQEHFGGVLAAVDRLRDRSDGHDTIRRRVYGRGAVEGRRTAFCGGDRHVPTGWPSGGWGVGSRVSNREQQQQQRGRGRTSSGRAGRGSERAGAYGPLMGHNTAEIGRAHV